MAFLIIHGSRIAKTYERSRRARCGRCLVKTTQAVFTVARSRHVYFIEFANDDLGRVAECETCQTTIPVRRSEAENRTERWADAFVDAHVLELDRADKSNWVSVGVAGLAVAFLLAMTLWFLLVGELPLDRNAMFWVGFVGVLALLGVAGWIYRGLQERVGDHVFARSARLGIGHVERRFEVKPADLVAAAHRRGYPRMARHFASARYAAHKPDGVGPYRSTAD